MEADTSPTVRSSSVGSVEPVSSYTRISIPLIFFPVLPAKDCLLYTSIAVRHRCIVRIGHLRKISCSVIAILDSIAVYIGIFDDPIKLIVFPCDSTIRVGCCEYITVFIVSVGSRSFRVGVSSDPAQCVVSKLGFLAPSVNQLRTKVERIVSCLLYTSFRQA